MSRDATHGNHNPKKPTKNYWSKRKRYGYGWTPVTWQGWSVLGVWFAFVAISGFLVLNDVDSSTESAQATIFTILVFGSSIPMVLVFYKTGPKPKWRWGKKNDDDPDLDW